MGGWEEALYSLLLALTLAMIVGKLFEELVIKLGLPPVIGDLIAGLLLGSSLLAIYPVTETVKVVSWLGVALLLFYAGLETRYRDFMRSLGLYGVITVGEAIAAFSLGFLVGTVFGYSPRSAYFIGAVLEATSISVSVRTLIDMGKLATAEGYAILGIAVLDDLTALITIVAGSSLIKTGVFSIATLIEVGALALMYWLITVLLLHRLANTVVLNSLKMRSSEGSTAIVLGLFSLFAYLTKYLKLSPLVAAYATGLALSEAHGIKRTVERIRPIALLFSVLFFMTTAAQLDITHALQVKYVPFYLAIVAAAFAGKIMGGGMTAFLVGFPPLSALRIAIGLFPRAEFCIIAAYIGYSTGLFGPEVYFAAVLITLITNIITPVLLKIAFSRGYEIHHVEPRWRRSRR